MAVCGQKQTAQYNQKIKQKRKLIDAVFPYHHHHICCTGHVPQSWPPSGHKLTYWWQK